MSAFVNVRSLFLRASIAIVMTMSMACPPPAVDGAECAVSTDCPDRGVCLEGACEACDTFLPAPNDVCLPVCGNSVGVGQPCSAGGSECNAWLNVPGGAFFCTVDFVADADLVMCTRPCGTDADCAEDAVCEGDPEDPGSDKGCVPASCSAAAE